MWNTLVDRDLRLYAGCPGDHPHGHCISCKTEWHDALPDITVAATNGLLVGDAPERLGPLPPMALLVANSITHNAGATIAPLLADAIARLHHGQIPAGSCPGLTPPAADPPAADHSVDV
jgi:hypothetical protein